VIWTEELLRDSIVDACQEGLDWMAANSMWGQPYAVIRAELERQVEAGEIDPKESAQWIRWSEAVERNGALLRKYATVVDDASFSVAHGGETYEKLTDEEARTLKRRLRDVVVREVVPVANGIQHRPTRRLIPGRKYILFDPRTGMHTEYTDIAALKAHRADIAQFKQDQIHVRRRVETADGNIGYEEIE
jgi:hypothetical protein